MNGSAAVEDLADCLREEMSPAGIDAVNANLARHRDPARRAARRKLWTFYPDEGPLRRELYPKHIAFLHAGAKYGERLMMAANRIGKTEGIGGYETTLHLTGLYPHWWEGRRFDKPIQAWAAGRTAATTRDILQAKLCGPVAFEGGRKTVAGTGLIPGDLIDGVSWKRGLADAVDIIKVRHVSGGVSTLGFKSFEQGRGAFEGTERDLVWLDEEPPMEVYVECLVRTMTTKGLVIVTFTPLQGMTELVKTYLEQADRLESLMT
jgi:phage terminase large subunit-like protein